MPSMSSVKVRYYADAAHALTWIEPDPDRHGSYHVTRRGEEIRRQGAGRRGRIREVVKIDATAVRRGFVASYREDSSRRMHFGFPWRDDLDGITTFQHWLGHPGRLGLLSVANARRSRARSLVDLGR